MIDREVGRFKLDLVARVQMANRDVLKSQAIKDMGKFRRKTHHARHIVCLGNN